MIYKFCLGGLAASYEFAFFVFSPYAREGAALKERKVITHRAGLHSEHGELNCGCPVGVDRPAANSKEQYQSLLTIRAPPTLGALICYAGPLLFRIQCFAQHAVGALRARFRDTSHPNATIISSVTQSSTWDL